MTDLTPTDSADSLNVERIRPVTPDEFLSPLGQWPTIGGLVMLSGFVGALGLAAVLPYKVVVKAPAVVRPAGEVRLVEAGAEGAIAAIRVKVNQKVRAGEVLATIRDSRLQTQKQQQQNAIASAAAQLQQIAAQVTAINQQIAAETEQQQRAIAAAQSDLKLTQRGYQNSVTVTQADLQEAAAALKLAQDELTRFRQLANTGAVSALQIQEKVAAVEVAKARRNKTSAALNPSNAEMSKAQEQVLQEQARGNATLARLRQDQQDRLRQAQETKSQLAQKRQELAQLQQDLKNTEIRAPVAGTILALNLRNVDQVVRLGDQVAQIAPANEAIVVKALVPSQDISPVEVGQSVQVRISACPYSDFGTLPGKVTAIAPDATPPSDRSTREAPATNERSLGTYAVTIQPTQLKLTDGNQNCLIQPGLDGRADIVTHQESVLKFVFRKAKLWIH